MAKEPIKICCKCHEPAKDPVKVKENFYCLRHAPQISREPEPEDLPLRRHNLI
jgi:hypothetical protein